MKLTTVSLTKHFKKGLPSYSNITIGTTLTWEIAEGEQFDFDKAWDIINQQLSIQANDETEQSWMRTKETTKNYISTIKTPKEVNRT